MSCSVLTWSLRPARQQGKRLSGYTAWCIHSHVHEAAERFVGWLGGWVGGWEPDFCAQSDNKVGDWGYVANEANLILVKVAHVLLGGLPEIGVGVRGL